MKNKRVLSAGGRAGLLTAMIIAASLSLPAAALAAGLPEVIPSGEAVGMRIQSEGAIVIDLVCEDGTDCSPAKEAGIRPGDRIVQIASETIVSAEDVIRVSKTLDGSPVTVRLAREDQLRQVTVTPAPRPDGSWSLGVWLRDSVTGIGTMTWVDPETGDFGALGHPISDTDTGILVPVHRGELYRVSASGAHAGKPGSPGQLQGQIRYDQAIGTISGNGSSGIRGVLYDAGGAATIPTAAESEIHAGEGIILCTVTGDTPKAYRVEITPLTGSGDRSMMVTVTDEALLAVTGGIVQGMSGSPILQDGKLIGAVTHVLVSNPKKGYGISAERMLAMESETLLAA